MRINKLEFSAVGPYANHQVIDFDVLGGSALYLIDGPTGAGKSTIIDCIVYALYNEMAGDASDPTRIRSQFAQPTQETWVELTFTTNSGSYRVRRSPAFKRPKKNGTGSTEEKPTAALWKLDSNGEVVETIEGHVREVGTMLSEKFIGLSKSQFVQTVVLPQGEFAKFLRAETKDREELLEKVFGTGLYKKVSELLDLKAKAAQGDRKLITDEIISLLDQYQTMVGYNDEQVVALKKLVTTGLDKDFLEEIEEAFRNFEEEHNVAKAEYDSALALLNDAKQVLKQREAEALAVSNKVDAEANVQQAIVDVDSSLAPVAEFESLLKTLGISTAKDQQSSQWEIHTQTASTERGATQALLDVEKRVEKWPVEAGQLAAIIADTKDSILKVDETLASLPKSIEELTSTVAVLPALRIDLHAAQEQHTTLLKQKELLADLAQLQQDKSDADQKLTDASKKAFAAIAVVTDLRERRIRGIAGELATSLTDGQPCVVCGSTEHPSPAQPDADAVTVDMIEEAEGLAKIAEKAQETAKKAVDALVVEIAQIEVQITVDVQNFDTVKAELDATISEICSKITTAVAAESEIEKLNAQRVDLIQQKGELQTSLSTTEQKLTDGKETYESDLKKLNSSLGDYGSIQEKFDAIDTLVTRLSAVTHSVGARERAQQELVEAEAAYSALEKSEEFAQVDAAQNKERELNSNALAIKTRFDVLADKLKDATNHVKSIQAKIDQRTKQAGSTQDLENLAKTFVKNSNGQSLNIYVLQSIFENVLSVANRSLESLLEGRYRLVSSDESDGHAAKRRGLGVNVEDIYTGAQRAAKTLSGGETFCASLALALGMAGVVRANAGGVSIDTLFIDEGFGSLDGDRLGDVMNMLQGIKNSGRTIGVISHVDEMKTQIAERIVVIPGGKDKPTTMEVTWM